MPGATYGTQEKDCPPARAAKEPCSQAGGRKDVHRIESLSGDPAPAVHDRGQGRRHSPLDDDHCQSRRNNHPRAMLMQEQSVGAGQQKDDCITDIKLSIIDNIDQKHIFRLLLVLYITFQLRSLKTALSTVYYLLLHFLTLSQALAGQRHMTTVIF